MAHNKKRNSLFLYEILIREYTKATIAEEKEKKEMILSLIKESFARGTELYKEWSSYRALLGFKTTRPIATKIFGKVVDNYKHINQDALAKEQGKLVKKINKALSPSVFQHFVPNYKSLASIYQMFHSRNMPVRKRVLLEEQIISEISNDGVEAPKTTVYEPISRLAMKTFVEKFNDKYAALLPEQKELLQKYAMTDEKRLELKAYLNEEVGRLKEIIERSLLLKEVKEDQEMVSKTKEVQKLLEFCSEREPDEEMIEDLLGIQQLAKEIVED